MTSREKILEAVLKNQPPATTLPDITMFKGDPDDSVQKYMDVFRSIGGTAFLVDDLASVKILIDKQFDTSKRSVTTLPVLADCFELVSTAVDPLTYNDVELAVINAHFAVAENGAVWLTEEVMGHRILPYICQHLAVVVSARNILPSLHEAYQKIGSADYGFAGFISGPSKTADIEQALVLGAHGPLTMTVFIMADKENTMINT
ncbi:MAG: LUD domain-containing protein [Ferruginibacter sp.]